MCQKVLHPSQTQIVAGKWEAVVKEIKRMNKTGRPVLVGTTSVEQSEFLAAQLQKDGELFTVV